MGKNTFWVDSRCESTGLDNKSFGSRDQKEVADYADVMDIVFEHGPWISFFLNALDAQKEMLSQKIERENIIYKAVQTVTANY